MKIESFLVVLEWCLTLYHIGFYFRFLFVTHQLYHNRILKLARIRGMCYNFLNNFPNIEDMMDTIRLLIFSVATLFCFLLCGFVLRKLRIADGTMAKSLSLLTVYLTQWPLYGMGFIRPFDVGELAGLGKVLLASLVIHAIFCLLAKWMFRRLPDGDRKVVTFTSVFANCGYMGLPLISAVLGDEFTFYASAYILGFNIFMYTVGRLIFTEDKTYISVKKIFLNPAVIPVLIGLVLYFTGAGGWIVDRVAFAGTAEGSAQIVPQAVKTLYDVLNALKNFVAPATMIITGIRLAETKWKDMLGDKHVWAVIAVRQFLLPVLVWGICRPLYALGILDADLLSLLVILASTPCAAAGSMFAELYHGDAPKAGRIVAASTLLSVVTMPLVALLLNL